MGQGLQRAVNAARATQGKPARSFRQQHPRHPAEVTADRLGDALDKWPDHFEPGDRDMVGQIIHILSQIAESTEGLTR